jgi:hypothetical protein
VGEHARIFWKNRTPNFQAQGRSRQRHAVILHDMEGNSGFF